MSSPNYVFHGISVHVSITVAPSDIDAFLLALKPVYDAVTAEPECTYFEVFHSLEEPGAFRFVENWSRSKEWFIEVCHAVNLGSLEFLDPPV